MSCCFSASLSRCAEVTRASRDPQPGVHFFRQGLLDFLQQFGAAMVNDQVDEIANRRVPPHFFRELLNDLVLLFWSDCGSFKEIAKIGGSIKRLDKSREVGFYSVRFDLFERDIGQRRRVSPCDRFVQFALPSSSRTNVRNREACASGVISLVSTASARSMARRAASALSSSAAAR